MPEAARWARKVSTRFWRSSSDENTFWLVNASVRLRADTSSALPERKITPRSWRRCEPRIEIQPADELLDDVRACGVARSRVDGDVPLLAWCRR